MHALLCNAVPYLDSSVPPRQVSSAWSQGGSQQGATIRMLLSSPGSATIPVPYTLTLSGGAPFLSASSWEWKDEITSAGQVGRVTFVQACML